MFLWQLLLTAISYRPSLNTERVSLHKSEAAEISGIRNPAPFYQKLAAQARNNREKRFGELKNRLEVKYVSPLPNFHDSNDPFEYDVILYQLKKIDKDGMYWEPETVKEISDPTPKINRKSIKNIKNIYSREHHPSWEKVPSRDSSKRGRNRQKFKPDPDSTTDIELDYLWI